MGVRWFVLVLGLSLAAFTSTATKSEDTLYWMKVRATSPLERSAVADTGVVIESIREDFVAALGNAEEKAQLEKMGVIEVSFPLTAAMDFPSQDAAFHNYDELTRKLRELTQKNPHISRMTSLGKSLEGRDIWHVQISAQLDQTRTLPGSVFMGGHHAREHLSVELPLYYIEYLISEYNAANPRIQALVRSRDIHFIPLVNPDGAEYDIADGRYKAWRKNRSRFGVSYGVDLNRNYGFGWGGKGASASPSSDTYRGPQAFSEPETQAIKKFIEDNENITILLSFHTFSELILYPWGHVYDSIAVARDKEVHEIMARKMATWNGYTPQQSSSLYIASGDTTDWAYGEHKVISFTFELDPKSAWGTSGFYPGAKVIPEVQRKNLEPVLYIIENSANPYGVLESAHRP